MYEINLLVFFKDHWPGLWYDMDLLVLFKSHLLSGMIMIYLFLKVPVFLYNLAMKIHMYLFAMLCTEKTRKKR